METLKIDYGSLVLIPLIVLNKSSISESEIKDYAEGIKKIYDSNLVKTNIDLSKRARLFFELTHFWWVVSEKNEEGISYSLREGVSEMNKRMLVNEIPEDVRMVLSSHDALLVFNNDDSARRKRL